MQFPNQFVILCQLYVTLVDKSDYSLVIVLKSHFITLNIMYMRSTLDSLVTIGLPIWFTKLNLMLLSIAWRIFSYKLQIGNNHHFFNLISLFFIQYITSNSYLFIPIYLGEGDFYTYNLFDVCIFACRRNFFTKNIILNFL